MLDNFLAFFTLYALVVMALIGGVVFPFFYEVFFAPTERKLRKTVLSLLQLRLYRVKRIGTYQGAIIKEFFLLHIAENVSIIYFGYTGDFGVFDGMNCILSSFCGDFFARRDRDKIIALLKKLGGNGKHDE